MSELRLLVEAIDGVHDFFPTSAVQFTANKLCEALKSLIKVLDRLFLPLYLLTLFATGLQRLHFLVEVFVFFGFLVHHLV